MSRRGRSHSEEGGIEGGEINLVPYLDIMVNLIMFMLVTYQVLIELHLISFNPPAASDKNALGPTNPDTKTKMLTVVIYNEGFKILTSDESAGTEFVPLLPSKDYDYEGLTQHLHDIKTSVKVDPHLIVVATPDIIYETVVDTLDAARCNKDAAAAPCSDEKKAKGECLCPSGYAELFPDVTLGMAVGSQ